MEDQKRIPAFKIFIGILLLVFLYTCVRDLISGDSNQNSTKTTAQTDLKLTQSQVDYIDKLVKENYISFEKANGELMNTVYISPVLWNGMDFKLKEDTSCALAIYIANKKGEQTIWVDILDKMTGKKLAKYSQTFGFKVY